MRPTIESELLKLRNSDNAVFAERFFKTGAGEYGEGDKFLGIRVPIVRNIAKNNYKTCNLDEIAELLISEWHEVRQVALFIMLLKYPKSSESDKGKQYNLYISQIGRGINNWDLVDVSCPHIVGAYLYNKSREPLYKLAKGELWQKRVSIISTFCFLRAGEVTDTLALSELLVNEKHDLLQKAVGWSLRELGKIDDGLLRSFLDTHAATMPRTMLRYSLEKLNKSDKQHYMTLKNVN